MINFYQTKPFRLAMLAEMIKASFHCCYVLEDEPGTTELIKALGNVVFVACSLFRLNFKTYMHKG